MGEGWGIKETMVEAGWGGGWRGGGGGGGGEEVEGVVRKDKEGGGGGVDGRGVYYIWGGCICGGWLGWMGWEMGTVWAWGRGGWMKRGGGEGVGGGVEDKGDGDGGMRLR